jgi:hypothetical protein
LCSLPAGRQVRVPAVFVPQRTKNTRHETIVKTRSYMKKTLHFFYLSLFILATVRVLAADTTIVKSPGSQVQFRVFTENNILSYSIRFKNVTVIKNSPFVFSLDNSSITEAAKIGTVKLYKINDSYPWTGAHVFAHNLIYGFLMVGQRLD